MNKLTSLVVLTRRVFIWNLRLLGAKPPTGKSPARHRNPWQPFDVDFVLFSFFFDVVVVVVVVVVGS